MTKLCPKCRKPFEEDDELFVGYRAYWQQIGSEKFISVTRPDMNDLILVEHLNCNESD